MTTHLEADPGTGLLCRARPLPGMEKIAGRIAFYNERVELFVDGERR